MKKHIGTIALAWLIPCITWAQTATVTAGTALNISSGTGLYISGLHLQNDNTGTITNSGTITVNGNASGRDIINNGTFSSNNGTVLMNGSTEQQVQGNTVVNVGTFSIDNGGNGVSVSNTGALRVHNVLNLTNGSLYTADNSPVRFASTASNPAETNTNHISGTAMMEARTVAAAAFPTFLLLGLDAGGDIGDLTLTRLAGNGTATARGFMPSAGAVSPIGFEGINAHWLINISNTASGTRNANFSWFPAWDNAKTLTTMQLWHTATLFNTALPWNSYGASSLDLSARTLSINSIPLATLHNAWSFSDLNNPLPLTFISLNARLLRDSRVEVTWKTQSEEKLSHFVVERSDDGKTFQPVFTQVARNQQNNTYTIYDEQAKDLARKILYYRIVSVEQNGEKNMSAAKSVYFDKSFAAEVFPNPFEKNLNVQVNNPAKDNVTFMVIDNLGRVLFQTQAQDELIRLSPFMELGNAPTGVYFLKVSNGTEQAFFKVLKQ